MVANPFPRLFSIFTENSIFVLLSFPVWTIDLLVFFLERSNQHLSISSLLDLFGIREGVRDKNKSSCFDLVVIEDPLRSLYGCLNNHEDKLGQTITPFHLLVTIQNRVVLVTQNRVVLVTDSQENRVVLVTKPCGISNQLTG